MLANIKKNFNHGQEKLPDGLEVNSGCGGGGGVATVRGAGWRGLACGGSWALILKNSEAKALREWFLTAWDPILLFKSSTEFILLLFCRISLWKCWFGIKMCTHLEKHRSYLNVMSGFWPASAVDAWMAVLICINGKQMRHLWNSSLIEENGPGGCKATTGQSAQFAKVLSWNEYLCPFATLHSTVIWMVFFLYFFNRKNFSYYPWFWGYIWWL